ncbi:MAG: phytanoyl-CoA dioxygenase family protein [Gammaproteobacteria bacterium]|nr:phytanoyl-CoA dioxygenase family protein [Gammaproteobacteria bacterium]
MRTLTEKQRTDWATNGFIRLEQAFDADEVAFYNAKIDEMRASPGWEPVGLQRGHYGWVEQCPSQDPEAFMDRRDILPFDQAFIDLIDRENVFDLVVDIMGPYILLSMSQAIVRASDPEFAGFTHTDGGEALRRIRVTETSRPLAMKALYLLSDVSGTDNGNFSVFPGSHLRPFPEDATPETLNPTTPGAVQLEGNAGDCFLFSHALWHGPAKNVSGKARKTLLYNYCQMCVRAYDFETTSEVMERATPRQRRLLGDLGHAFRPGSYFYSPEDQIEVIQQTA